MVLTEDFEKEAMSCIKGIIEKTETSKPTFDIVKEKFDSESPIEFSYGFTMGMLEGTLIGLLRQSYRRGPTKEEIKDIQNLISQHAKELKYYFYKAEFR